MKARLLLASLALSLLPVTAHADITIGVSGPYTGSVAAWGLSQQAGIKQAVEDINAKGGINGQKITLKIDDDACDPKQAVTIANKTASANIHFALPGTCSAASIAAMKTYIDEGILTINPLASNPKVTDEGGPLVFRAMYRDDNNAVVLADEIQKHFAQKKLVILHDKSAYGQGIAEGVRARLHKAGIDEILFDTYDPANHDYAVLVTRMKELGTEALFVGGYPVEIGALTRQLRQAGSKAQIIAGDLSTPDFWKVAGDTGEGVLFAFPADPRKEPGAQQALVELKKSGAVIDGYTLYGYAAMQVLAQAMATANSQDPAKVADVIHKNQFDTILGKWAFDQKGDVQNIRLVIYQWHKGEFEEHGK